MADSNNDSQIDQNIDKDQNYNGTGEGNNDNAGSREGNEGNEKKTFTLDELNEKISEKDSEIAKYRRMAEQRGKKLEEFEKGGDKTSKKSESNSQEFGYGEKAFLKSSGFNGDEEFTIIRDAMKFTGKTLDEVIETNYVKIEIDSLRKQRQAEDAMPKGNNRSGSTSRTSVDYWLQKGELPPADQTDLRRKVVNAKIAQNKNKSKFGQ